MKLILIGANGTVGNAITKELGTRHDIIRVGKTSGDIQLDIGNSAQVRDMFARTGKVDGVVIAAGSVHFGAWSDMEEQHFHLGLNSKLMGQVNVAHIGQQYLNDGGSITLTSGIVGEVPVRFGVNAAMVNAAIEGFVRGAAIELPRGLRINAVSPALLDESVAKLGHLFLGLESVSSKRVALGYARSVDGAETGRVYKVR